MPPRRGCSVYKTDARGLLVDGFDVVEPAPIKGGDFSLNLLSFASKIIKEPLRVAPLLCFLIYCQQLFLAEGQLLPGPSALALDTATWIEVRDLSLNFWFVGPSLFGGFPVVHPGLEGIFNLVPGRVEISISAGRSPFLIFAVLNCERRFRGVEL